MAVFNPKPHSTGAGLAAGVSNQQFVADQNAAAAAARKQAAGQKAMATSAARGGKPAVRGAAGGPAFGATPINAKATPATNMVMGAIRGTDAPPAQPPSDMGLNFAEHGPVEKFFSNTQDEYTAPTASGSYANYVANKYDQGTPGVTKYSVDAYQRGINMQPNTSANMGAYYDNAKRRAQESIDSAMAARGLYSSSAATDRISEAFTDLEAQRARDEADYGLKYSADQRSWAGLGGDLASAADASSLAASNNERGWLESLGGIFSQADNTRLGYLQAGTSAAQAAQEAQRARGSDLFNRQMGISDRMSDLAGDTYDSMITGDQDLMDTILGLILGDTSSGINSAKNRQDERRRRMDEIGDDAVAVGKAIATYGGSEAAKEA